MIRIAWLAFALLIGLGGFALMCISISGCKPAKEPTAEEIAAQRYRAEQAACIAEAKAKGETTAKPCRDEVKRTWGTLDGGDQ